jgi:hypothetical protein
MKYMVIITLLLSGCAFDPSIFKPDTEIKVVTVNVPLLYCPAPPTFTYPRLVIEDLMPGDEKDPGRVSQFYKATVKQLEGEIVTRDITLDAYRAISTQSPNMSPADVDKMFKDLIKK